MTTVLAAFVLGLVLALILTPLAARVGQRLGAVDPPSERRVHFRPIPRFGGPAVLGAFLCSLALITLLGTDVSEALSLDRHLSFLLMGGLIIFATGAADDLWRLDPKTKLALQIVACSLAFYGGNRFNYLPIPDNAWLFLTLSYLQTVFWFLLFINAVNLIDGVDGLAGGLVFFLCMVMVFLSLSRQEYILALIFAALAGSILGFLRYNFNPASIFLGDSGSYLLGYSVAGLGIYGSVKSPVGSIMLISIVALGIPLIDTLLAPLRRFVRGRRLFSPDKKHIHHLLLSTGMTARRVTLFLYFVTIILCQISIVIVHTRHEFSGMLLVVLGLTGFFVFQKSAYLEYLAMDKILGWMRDMFETSGLSHSRRTFLNVQIDMAQSDNFHAFWDKCQNAFELLGLDHVTMTLSPEAQADREKRRVSPCSPFFSECSGTYTWSRKDFDLETRLQDDWFLEVKALLSNNAIQSSGSLWVIKDSQGNGLDSLTLRRIDQLRKTMADVLGRLTTRISSDFFGTYLVKQGVITKDQLEHAVALHQENNSFLGKLAVDRGYLTREQLEIVLREQTRSRKAFGQLAQSLGYLQQEQVTDLLKSQSENHVYIGEALVRFGFIRPETLDLHLEHFRKNKALSRGSRNGPMATL